MLPDVRDTNTFFERVIHFLGVKVIKGMKYVCILYHKYNICIYYIYLYVYMISRYISYAKKFPLLSPCLPTSQKGN